MPRLRERQTRADEIRSRSRIGSLRGRTGVSAGRTRRRRLPVLTAGDRRTISEAKAGSHRVIWEKPSERFPGCMDRMDVMGLSSAVGYMGTNFVSLIEEMQKKRFHGRTINVLIEGCGRSPIGEELELECKKRGIKISVVKTDIYSKKKFEELTAEETAEREKAQKGTKIRTDNYHRLSPEELRKLGRGKFHLVISRTGGVTYTGVPQTKALQSINHILAPQGEAHLFTEDVYRQNTRRLELAGKKIKLKDENGRETPEARYLTRTRGISSEIWPMRKNVNYVVMRKGLPVSDMWRDKIAWENSEPHPYRQASQEERDAHTTIFDEMKKPPVPMTAEQFKHLRNGAWSVETSYGLIGRHPASCRVNIGKPYHLEFDYGRYYIYEIDEMGAHHYLWREPNPPLIPKKRKKKVN